MAFLHGLVKIRTGEKLGWCAPVELGESTPHRVSYVISVDDGRRPFDEYRCEIAVTTGKNKKVERNSSIKRSADSFSLVACGMELWFTLRPGKDEKRQLPYIGNYTHEDFRSLFIEIEPEDPGKLDELYNDSGAFVIGCEPVGHHEKRVDDGEPRQLLPSS